MNFNPPACSLSYRQAGFSKAYEFQTSGCVTPPIFSLIAISLLLTPVSSAVALNHGVGFVFNNGTLVADHGGREVIPEKNKGKDLMEKIDYMEGTG